MRGRVVKSLLKEMLPDEWKELLQANGASTQEINTLLDTIQEKVVDAEIHGKTVFPPWSKIFRALELTPPDKVKAVILGQDPYHGKGQANGLSFSVPEGIKLPPSLQNIYKELADDYGGVILENGDLSGWARQGVLLLNTVLTVTEKQAGSHHGWGWEQFTDKVIHAISEERSGIVFILWGSKAQQKIDLIDTSNNYIIKSSHPSPLAAWRGFFGSQPFSKTNRLLEKEGREPIKWTNSSVW